MAQKKTKRGGRFGLLLLLVVVVSAIWFFWNNFAVVRVIEVTGVSIEDAQYIAQKSGIAQKKRLSALDQESIRRALKELGQWELMDIETEEDGTVRLVMRQRVARAVASYAGSNLVMDSFGQVMEYLRTDPEYPLLQVEGLIFDSAQVGEELPTRDPNQRIAMVAVINALDSSGAYSRVQVLNVADLDNMYLVADNGTKVEIGDRSQMESKMNWMQAVLDSIKAEGKSGGKVDVSTGVSAVYAPN